MFRKFKILNESEIEFLTEHLTRKIQSWCDSWAPETKFEIKVQNPYRDNGSSHAFLEQSEIVIYELNLNEWLLLFKEQVFNSRFIFDTYGLESGKQITGKPSDLVQEFSEKAVKEMMEAILSATETGSCSSRGLSRDSDEDIVKDSMDKGRGTALVTISMSGLQINIIMSPMAVSAIIPKKNIGSEIRPKIN